MTGRPPGDLAGTRRRHRMLTGGFDVWLCADVGLQVGPPGRTTRVHDLEPLLGLGWDAIILTVPMIERLGPLLAAEPALRVVARLDWTSQWRTLASVEEGASATVASVERAAALGADAVIHYLLLGREDSEREAVDVGRAAATVAAAHAVGLPCVLEPLLRGSRVAGREREAAHQIWAVRTAAELGADAVKIEAPEEPELVLRDPDVPILIASTPPLGDDAAVDRAALARRAGAAGVAYSGDVLGSPSPSELVRRLRAL